MGLEKNFENKLKKFLKDNNIWYVKYFANSFTKSGIPDVLACVNGYFVAIEVKAPNGEASELQIHNLSEIECSGGIGILLYPNDFEDFKMMIDNLLSEDVHKAWDIADLINAKHGLKL